MNPIALTLGAIIGFVIGTIICVVIDSYIDGRKSYGGMIRSSEVQKIKEQLEKQEKEKE